MEETFTGLYLDIWGDCNKVEIVAQERQDPYRYFKPVETIVELAEGMKEPPFPESQMQVSINLLGLIKRVRYAA